MMEDVAPEVDAWMCSVYDVYKRFGRWDEMLAEPMPPKEARFMTGIWHYGRSLAYLHRGDAKSAKK